MTDPAPRPGPGELPLPMEGARMVRTVPADAGALTSTRTKARRAAVDLLFEAEARGMNAGGLLDERVAQPTTQAPLREYTVTAVRGVVDHWADIDETISSYSHGWALDRMPAVDRQILRVAAWEIFHNDDVPDAVAVAEAVTLAGALSTDGSASFIGGLLSRLVEVKPSLAT